MLTGSQLDSIREILERSHNPFFLYDNDADGFCSHLLLRRFLGRGKGSPVRTHPEIDAGYARKAHSLGSDLIVVLDCPFLGVPFIEEAESLGIPVLWIDHHAVEVPTYTYPALSIFNPTRDAHHATSEPITYWCYRISERTDDMWIAMMGCIADHYLPRFSKAFASEHPDFWKKRVREPFDAYYGSDIGLLARVIGFVLKDSLRHVVMFQDFMIDCTNPNAFLSELALERSFAVTYRTLRTRYDALLAEAVHCVKEKIVFFQYGGQTSMSADLANELSYRYPQHYIVVAYVSGGFCNLSLRGKKVRTLLERLLPLFPGSRGGGHLSAVGARIGAEDLDRFVSTFQSLL